MYTTSSSDGFKIKGSEIIVLVGTNAYTYTYTAAAGSYDVFYKDLIGMLTNTKFTN